MAGPTPRCRSITGIARRQCGGGIRQQACRTDRVAGTQCSEPGGATRPWTKVAHRRQQRLGFVAAPGAQHGQGVVDYHVAAVRPGGPGRRQETDRLARPAQAQVGLTGQDQDLTMPRIGLQHRCQLRQRITQVGATAFLAGIQQPATTADAGLGQGQPGLTILGIGCHHPGEGLSGSQQMTISLIRLTFRPGAAQTAQFVPHHRPGLGCGCGQAILRRLDAFGA